MNKSEQINELATALAKAQGQMKPAVMDCKNPHFNSRYASLTAVMEACRIPLSSNGLAFTQIETYWDGKPYLETTLIHCTGQFISGLTPLLIDKNNMQGLGSAITYAKRYALAAMVGVVDTEDDDGNAASKEVNKIPKPTPTPTKGQVIGKPRELPAPKAKNLIDTKVATEVIQQSAPTPFDEEIPDFPAHPPSTKRQGAKVISDAQRKRLFAISSNAGLDEQNVKEILKNFGYDSSKDIQWPDYDAIIQEIENAGK